MLTTTYFNFYPGGLGFMLQVQLFSDT